MRTNNSRECPSSSSLYGIITLSGRCYISHVFYQWLIILLYEGSKNNEIDCYFLNYISIVCLNCLSVHEVKMAGFRSHTSELLDMNGNANRYLSLGILDLVQ